MSKAQTVCKRCGSTSIGPRGTCKACRSAYDAARYSPEKSKAKFLAWRLANLERNRARVAAWRVANIEKRKEYQLNYRAANPEKIRAIEAASRAKNPETSRVKSLNRRARKLESGGELSKDIAERLFKLQRGKCACGCGLTLGKDFHRDHRMPLALGGSNTDDNIQLLRQRCNNQKGAKDPVEFMQQKGFLL